MKLTKIYFDAFKSLLNEEIEIKGNCIGLVGINESGKSNILQAVNVLKGGYILSEKDGPKMRDGNINPSIRYEFKLTQDEQNQILDKIKDWSEGSSLIGRDIEYSDFNLIYKIEFDQKTKKNIYSCQLRDFKLNKGYFVLKRGFIGSNYKVKIGNQFVPINIALIINDKILTDNKKYLDSCNEFENLDTEIGEINQKINEWNKISDQAEKNKLYVEEIKKNEANLVKLTKKKDELTEKCKEFNIYEFKNKNLVDLKNLEKQILSLKKTESEYKKKVIQLENITNPTPPQKSQLTQINNKLIETGSQLGTIQKQKDNLDKVFDNLRMPLEEKYTSDSNEIFEYISNSILLRVEELLPKVVFWEHNDKFILQSTTLFKDITSKSSLDEISRPLVNLFRIGLGIKSLAELKVKISQIPQICSQLNKKMNKKVNEYLSNVWTEYDQKLNISLENDRIRVEIYDPKYENASFYNMEERSQGAKTFLSFLFTIGAEAKHGIIKNSILILDEPESHLHPSGVRYLLKELKRIADKDNQVIYATHSIFMIDRSNYDGHYIISKKNEISKIEPSCKDRKGFFMQEEVLYSTLDIDLSKEFSSTGSINFVFEGDGDVELFKHYYSKILSKKPYKLQDVSFFHGGGCKNIKKFLINKPIQLGTKWIFVLDKDTPANKLKEFITGRYKSYINEDIFVSQYNVESKSGEIVLEDLLEKKIILDCYKKIFEKYEIGYSDVRVNEQKKDLNFNEYSKKIITSEVFQEDYDNAKGDFKKILNSTIEEKLSKIKSEDEFKKVFPDYLNWVKSVIDSFDDKKMEKAPGI
ncbi:MAG: AAA family ATPase [Candidatus Delongbacteria bacterium]|jgi:hypothetical protein|nr:AAA family ATPase [Candidatus Delongbacteria bacterium]